MSDSRQIDVSFSLAGGIVALPEEIAAAAVFLASHGADMIDGGYTII